MPALSVNGSTKVNNVEQFCLEQGPGPGITNVYDVSGVARYDGNWHVGNCQFGNTLS